jgi:Na+/proline symporter
MLTLLGWPLIVAGFLMMLTAIIALPGFFQPSVKDSSQAQALVTRWLGPVLFVVGLVVVVLGLVLLG